MNRAEHKRLIDKFLSLGGNKRIADSSSSFSLQNYAKIKYELKKLQEAGGDKQEAESNRQEAIGEKSIAKSQSPVANRRKPFDDLISEYPLELHSTYRKRWEVWLLACSLKTQLNEIGDAEQEEKAAFELQMKIYECFQMLDICQNILKHYREHKRIMPTESKKDYSQMTELELFKERNNLRALITRRRQTIERLEAESNTQEAESYKWQHSLNLKREQLQEKINELKEIEAILNNGK